MLAAQAVAADASPSGWRAVLVAGDNAQPVFDNAVNAVQNWLASGGVPGPNIHVLSATPVEGKAEPASAERVLARIAALRPGPGEACLVFVTSHGQRGEGIWLAYSGEFLRPAELAQALSAGRARAPTVVVASGCFTGGFTALRAPNRISSPLRAPTGLPSAVRSSGPMRFSTSACSLHCREKRPGGGLLP